MSLLDCLLWLFVGVNIGAFVLGLIYAWILVMVRSTRNDEL